VTDIPQLEVISHLAPDGGVSAEALGPMMRLAEMSLYLGRYCHAETSAHPAEAQAVLRAITALADRLEAWPLDVDALRRAYKRLGLELEEFDAAVRDS
jgi:uncharacterized membrane protein YccC